MAPQSIRKTKCSSGACPLPKKTSNQNGKGDNIRPFVKKKYDKNYESINWKRK
jgi:hypothetical protein